MAVNADIQEVQNALAGFKGEVYADELSLGIYATDASVYQIKPLLVVVPVDEADVLLAHRVADKYGLPVLPRGAGTSLAGQTVGEAMVIDFSRHMTQILHIDPEARTARVQPGVIHQSLNRELKKYNLLYGPDPATSSRANMGGIIANNSSGSHSIVYGKAVNHLVEMKVALHDGTVLHLKNLTRPEVEEKARQSTKEGAIYATLLEIISEHKELIINRYPKVMRRVTGYNLDEFAKREDWNLSRLICGSEGTLATILEVTVSLNELPAHKAVCVVHFHDRMEAIKSVKAILDFEPAAVELLDKQVIDLALTNPSTREISGFIEGRPGGLLIVEFFGASREALDEKYRVFRSFLEERGMGYAYPYFHQLEQASDFENIWEVRKQGLGLLLSIREDAKPQPFIEDACVPVEVLADYIGEVTAFCERIGTPLILYAHASVGVLHVRPFLDLRKKGDIEKFKDISNHVFNLVVKYGGSWSGEHGDGLVRSPRIKDFFGEEIYSDFVKIKNAFDPRHLMNPGKIIDAGPMDRHLRYGADYRDRVPETVFHYRKELSFRSLVHMCNGIGVCQRTEDGVMCPSYKASRQEKDSTRARANALRLTMAGKLGGGDFASDELAEVLDLCISCKSCKTECPSNVDVAKMKSEVLQLRHDKYGLRLREKLILKSDAFARRFSGSLSRWVNWGQGLLPVRLMMEKMAGLDRRRRLPSYASESLVKWYQRSYQPPAAGREVVLFADTYINYHEPQVGKAIIRLLTGFGFKVILVDTGGSKRPLISNGFLREAKRHAEKTVNVLRKHLEAGVPVIVCEPSAYSALKEDLPDLLDDDSDAALLSDAVISLEKMTAGFLRKHPEVRLKSTQAKNYFFGHCHQKALEGTKYLREIFERASGTYEEIEAGCCGMAGAFGYEREHYDFSKKIFDMDLGQKLKQLPADVEVLASGFSCRHQIKDFDTHAVKHWVEVLEVEKKQADAKN